MAKLRNRLLFVPADVTVHAVPSGFALTKLVQYMNGSLHHAIHGMDPHQNASNPAPARGPSSQLWALRVVRRRRRHRRALVGVPIHRDLVPLQEERNMCIGTSGDVRRILSQKACRA